MLLVIALTVLQFRYVERRVQYQGQGATSARLARRGLLSDQVSGSAKGFRVLFEWHRGKP